MQDAKATVKSNKYSWGTMKTIHHGNHFSIPLHPEHHQAIAKLKDEQEHQFKTEDGKHWTARRKGDEVHFQGANNGGKTTVSHSSMKEEQMKTYSDLISQLDEYNSKEGVYRHKGKYGTSHDDSGVKSKPFWQATDKDEDDKPKKAEAPAVKRGRGRPAGAKSGARQFGAAAKDGNGADYTGMKLHLPNSNK